MSEISEFFTELGAFVNEAGKHALEASPDAETIARLLVNIRTAKRLLGIAEQEVEDELINAWPSTSKKMAFDGIGECEQHSGAKRNEWDRSGLMTACSHAIADIVPPLVNAETGEPFDQIKLVRALLDAFIDAATPSWKVTGLRAYGIDPDEYCTTVWGRKTVQTPTLETFLEV